MQQPPTPTQRVIGAVAGAKAWLDSPAGTRVRRWFSYALSLLILLILVRAIADIGWREVLAVLPPSLLFWALFAGSYFLQPWTEWHIYRRWWGFGWPALAVFLKMRVMNEAIFSYSGHTYLLVWAANRMGISFDPDAPAPRLLGRGDTEGADPRTSPFAAVKDMAITSGLAGNFSTLLMLMLALAMGGDDVVRGTIDPATLRLMEVGFGGLILLNIGILIFRGKVMSIPVAENLFAFRWHLFRVLATQALIIASWIVALPAIPYSTWILLGALRMVIGRMPLPNKELLFAAIAVSLTGDASVQVAALMAAQGALHLVFHGIAWVAASAIEAADPEVDQPAAP